MSKSDLALADLIRDLARAEDRRKKRFAAIVRFVRRCEASGPAQDVMGQIRRDYRLCQLLVDYETEFRARPKKMNSPSLLSA